MVAVSLTSLIAVSSTPTSTSKLAVVLLPETIFGACGHHIDVSNRQDISYLATALLQTMPGLVG